MRILVVAATSDEIAPLVAGLRARPASDSPIMRYTRGGHDVDVLTTGVGMVATAARCSRALASDRYDLAFNFGICGSFDAAFPPGRVVHVIAERLPELGAEDGDAFLSLDELHVAGAAQFPFVDGRIVNDAPPVNSVLRGLPAVEGVTVNTVHGNERSIAAIKARYAPQVESMEGAAFMYSCLVHGVRCAEVRAVSNVVERRNRGAWKVAEAIAALGETALALLDHA